MIKNEFQLKRTQIELNKLKNIRRNTTQLLVTHFQTKKFANVECVSTKIEELENDIRSFKQVYPKSLAISLSDLNNLGKNLVMARIAVGYSQQDLARQCNLKQQQISRHESDLYKSASLERLTLVVDVLQQALCMLNSER